MDFDQICVLIAAVLAAFSVKRYRLICFVVFANFAVFEVTAHYMLIALDGAPAWPLHALYVIISGLTVIALVKLRCMWPLYTMIFLFSIYNLIILTEFIVGSMGFHANFRVIASIQMIVELALMLLMNKGTRYVWNRYMQPNRSYDYFVDRIFADCFDVGYTRAS